eukprot:10270310-Karenia_brevis.AAC.1
MHLILLALLTILPRVVPFAAATPHRRHDWRELGTCHNAAVSCESTEALPLSNDSEIPSSLEISIKEQ